MRVLLALLLSPAAMASSPEPNGSLTIERIAAIKHPSSPQWSPDGSSIAFLWDAAGNQNLFVVRPNGEPRQLTYFEPSPDTLTGDISETAWLSDDEMLALRDGKLYRISIRGDVHRFGNVDGVSDFELLREPDRLVLVRRGQIWVGTVEDRSWTETTALEPPQRAGALSISPDGRHIAFVSTSATRVADVLPYNGSKQALYRNEISGRRLGVVSTTASGAPRWIDGDGRPSHLQWAGNDTLVFQRTSTDMKKREIIATSLDGTTRVVHTDIDERWWSPLRRDAQTVVSPTGEHVAFVSDATGWSHLYVRPVRGNAPPRQLTHGAFEAGFGSWSPDGRRIAFYDNDGSPMERRLRVVDIETGEIVSVGNAEGVSYWPRFSPDGKRLAFERTDPRSSAELYVVEAREGASPTRLTHSMPDAIDEADLTTPEAVAFPSRVDGQQVPGTLFVPKNLDRSQQHPAIVWIHGSGSDQNFLGWHPFSYRMYYSANQYLAQQGYVILAVDYRGSSGYGRDWGTGHHLDLGGPDALDVASGADYLKTLPYIDPDRIGVWGLSYGGFLTLQVLTRTPTLFRCGINVAGVSDWATWGLESNGGWITGRMSTPRDNADGYVRSASIRHMESLERPLLMLHGTADVNVAFRESLNLVDVLLKLGKDFDFELYPGELHFFRREHILRDAWRRAERFFDAHLKHGERMTSR